MIRIHSGVPKVALVSKTTSEMRTPLNQDTLTSPNSVHHLEKFQITDKSYEGASLYNVYTFYE